ncbi:WHG domain-containing protein [Cellulomonas sp. JH27-2]|uniref:TetR/AcrR family transcriptional regulator n=1 Tax=Cellulomonas sp. JH27-2 TaxID=2774139 RepID=UPI001786C4BE|nr:TetR/AcrR family transcriptional regulator [Cellulomonas sp. JH27-2]MBD8060265.1 WHG domain-containing protein [Cellulomonas sp. JH27-2]
MGAARRRVREDGAAQLSLRAVARDLGVASSAVYRYVDSRDALLTLLVIEAFDGAGAACEEAAERAIRAGADPARTWLAVARGFRTWAHHDRHSFELIYGTPVPGYLAPQDTVRHATRVWGVLGATVARALADGTLQPTGPRLPAAGMVTDGVLEFARGVGGPGGIAGTGADDVPDGASDDDIAAGVVRSAVLFAALLGAVSMELYGHLHGVMTDADRVFDVTMATVAAGVGLHVPLDDVTAG